MESLVPNVNDFALQRHILHDVPNRPDELTFAFMNGTVRYIYNFETGQCLERETDSGVRVETKGKVLKLAYMYGSEIVIFVSDSEVDPNVLKTRFTFGKDVRVAPDSLDVHWIVDEEVTACLESWLHPGLRIHAWMIKEQPLSSDKVTMHSQEELIATLEARWPGRDIRGVVQRVAAEGCPNAKSLLVSALAVASGKCVVADLGTTWCAVPVHYWAGSGKTLLAAVDYANASPIESYFVLHDPSAGDAFSSHVEQLFNNYETVVKPLASKEITRAFLWGAAGVLNALQAELMSLSSLEDFKQTLKTIFELAMPSFCPGDLKEGTQTHEIVSAVLRVYRQASKCVQSGYNYEMVLELVYQALGNMDKGIAKFWELWLDLKERGLWQCVFDDFSKMANELVDGTSCVSMADAWLQQLVKRRMTYEPLRKSPEVQVLRFTKMNPEDRYVEFKFDTYIKNIRSAMRAHN